MARTRFRTGIAVMVLATLGATALVLSADGTGTSALAPPQPPAAAGSRSTEGPDPQTISRLTAAGWSQADIYSAFFIGKEYGLPMEALLQQNASGGSWRGQAFEGPVRLEIGAKDEVSGIVRVAYRVDGGEWQTFTSAFTITGTGKHLVEVTAEDAAGNVTLAQQNVEIR